MGNHLIPMSRIAHHTKSLAESSAQIGPSITNITQSNLIIKLNLSPNSSDDILKPSLKFL